MTAILKGHSYYHEFTNTRFEAVVELLVCEKVKNISDVNVRWIFSQRLSLPVVPATTVQHT